MFQLRPVKFDTNGDDGDCDDNNKHDDDDDDDGDDDDDDDISNDLQWRDVWVSNYSNAPSTNHAINQINFRL